MRPLQGAAAGPPAAALSLIRFPRESVRGATARGSRSGDTPVCHVDWRFPPSWLTMCGR